MDSIEKAELLLMIMYLYCSQNTRKLRRFDMNYDIEIATL